jgi:hypothetical protein
MSHAAMCRRADIMGYRTMNPQEKQLISDVFTRLRDAGRDPKDQDAEIFIRDLVRQFPDAPYFLTQSVIVQQQALEQADARVRELEEAARSQQGSERTSGGSFLGSARDNQPPPARPGPWGNEPPSSQPPRQQGGFLSSALSTATGVAGGMFLAESIRSLFGSVGGRSYASGESSVANSNDQAALDRAQDDAQDAEDDADKARQDLAADDKALDDMQDAQDDGDDDWSDDDDGIDV